MIRKLTVVQPLIPRKTLLKSRSFTVKLWMPRVTGCSWMEAEVCSGSPSPPLPFTGSHGEVPELPMSPPLGPFSALAWSPPACPHSQQSGPAPWELGPGSPLPADMAAQGPSLSPFLPPPTAHLLGQASLAQVHTPAALSSLRASLHSFGGAPTPPAALGVPPQRHHRRPAGVGYSAWKHRRGEAGRGAGPVTSLPGAQPCSCRVLHPVCTGREPHFSWPGVPGGQRRELAPTAVLTDQRLGEAGRRAPSLPAASAWLPSLLHARSLT